MRSYYKFKETRDFVTYTLTYVHGAILDLGSGRSKYRGLIEKHGDSFTTLDVVPGPGVDIVSSIEKTPLNSESIDTIYCTQVFEHIPKPWLAAEEIQRILAKGGHAIISAPFLQGFHADPNDYYRYTVQGLEAMFDLPELELVESGAYGAAFSMLVDMFRKRFVSEYKPKSRFTRKSVNVLLAIGRWLDQFVHTRVLYMNTYVIVRKKS